ADARALADEYCHDLVCIPHHASKKFTFGFYAELAMNLVSSLPYAIGKYRSEMMERKVRELASPELFDIVVCDFLAPAINVPRNLPCRTVLFQHNVEAIIWKRHYETQKNPVKRAYLYSQWRKMKTFEAETCRRFDQVIAVSRGDRDLMEDDYKLKAIVDVSTGV